MEHQRPIELLAPARDAECGIAAIRCGADAVYIGAPQFGARQAAGNSLDDIARVAEFAHQYYARVYAAVNTLLHDTELAAAEKLIDQLYAAGVDGLIIQDAGLLELELPPIPLIASTQMHNADADKIQFLEAVGFKRAILARELTLDQIRDIRSKTSLELECFVHGALCVSQSGQCWASYAIGGRSGNRGQCAQPCRKRYRVLDADGKQAADWRYWMSIKDLCLGDHLEELIDAGVTTFKIEGRLKDLAYVVNTVAYYRQRLDGLLAKKQLSAASSGRVQFDFEPDITRTFSRGFTDFGLLGDCRDVGSVDTPKSIGRYIGTVKSLCRGGFVLDRPADLTGGDGICFFDSSGQLNGTVVNGAEGSTVYALKIEAIAPGMKIYCNYDHRFVKRLEQCPAERKIGIVLRLGETADGLVLSTVDEDGVSAAVEMKMEKPAAQKKDQARQAIQTQLTKFGETIFNCTELTVEAGDIFLPMSKLNALRRELTEALLQKRKECRPVERGGIIKNSVPYPQAALDYTGNVLNEKARAFYVRHGVQNIEPAAESGLPMDGKLVMTTKYCLRRQMGVCGGTAKQANAMFLEDEDGRRFRVEFLCGPCGMKLYL